ncbi:unnamed protein product [Sympodiomycopsis kandeliae]
MNSADSKPQAIRWVPLESNPELFTNWSSALGLDTNKYAYHDIFGLDPSLLSMVPQPVEAVLLLFPVSEGYEKQRLDEDQDREISQEGNKDGELIWWKQTIGNACGTMGLLHSLANTSVRRSLSPDSPLAKLISQAQPLNPIQRAELLTHSKELEAAHTTAASGGQTAAPDANDSIDLHFTCFVRDQSSGELIELDGRRKGPVRRGIQLASQEDLLEGACKWVQDNYMAMDPNAVQFNLIALGPPLSD